MIQLFSVKDLSKKYTHPQKLKVFKKIMRFLKVCTNTPEIRVLKKKQPTVSLEMCTHGIISWPLHTHIQWPMQSTSWMLMHRKQAADQGKKSSDAEVKSNSISIWTETLFYAFLRHNIGFENKIIKVWLKCRFSASGQGFQQKLKVCTSITFGLLDLEFSVVLYRGKIIHKYHLSTSICLQWLDWLIYTLPQLYSVVAKCLASQV